MFTITLDQPRLVDDLVRFLLRMGFDAAEVDYGTVVAHSRASQRASARNQLQLYVSVWRATHDAVGVSIQA